MKTRSRVVSEEQELGLGITEIWYYMILILFHSVQFSSVAQSCPTLCNPMDHSTPGLPVHHQLPGFTQAHVHWVSNAIQTSHPLLSPSPPAFNRVFSNESVDSSLCFPRSQLIPACASSSSAFLFTYSAYKLSKQGDNIQPWVLFSQFGTSLLFRVHL